MTAQPRQPHGVSTGGQYTNKTHAEAEGVVLDITGADAVSPDAYEINDMVTELSNRLGADIDDDEMNELTHQVIAAFEEAQRRTARSKRIAATLGADRSASARALAEVGEKLGLEFKQDPHVDFDDWQADIGNGRAVVLSPQDPNRITFVGADRNHYVADVVDTGDGGAPSWPRFDKDGGSQWLRRVRPFIEEARKGGNLAGIAEHLENP